jgi:hypothetical protein
MAGIDQPDPGDLDMNPLNRRRFGWRVLALAAGAGGLPAFAQGRRIPLEVWKSPTCGCCAAWVEHLEAHGFAVQVFDTGNTATRRRLGVAQKYGSCHTARVAGYAIEGHVPAADIHRLLRERPAAIGLAVPGMPIGSPGMDGPEYGGQRDAYAVLLLQKDGSATIFSHHV